MSKHDVHFSSDKMDYGTPQWFFDFWNERFYFDVDVCADANNHKMPNYYDLKKDALSISWKKQKCWMNPPYGRDIANWMKKAYEEAKEGALVCCLVPSRTDTDWWHNYVMKGGHIFFVKGRITFDGAPTGAPFPSAVVILYMPQWNTSVMVDSISLKKIKNHKQTKGCLEHGVYL